MLYVSMIVIIAIGTSLHFLYHFSGHNKFVAFFAAVNESTWEHIKIGMTPTILWSLYDGIVYGTNGNYLIAKSFSLLTIIVLIPILFYSYTHFTKKSILVVDIICFCITIICSQLIFDIIIKLNSVPFIFTYLSCIVLFVEIACYSVFTFNPIKNFIFEDPITHKFSLSGHPEMHHHNHKH